MTHPPTTGELFPPRPEDNEPQQFDEGAWLLPGFALDQADTLIEAIHAIEQAAPFRHLITPGGRRMSVAMTNCGTWGWTSSREGYRYVEHDPDSDRSWPTMPAPIRALARHAADTAGYPDFDPDACLVNRYRPGDRLTLHQDRDEQDFTRPIVSVSLGLPATFLFGGAQRRERQQCIPLAHGDVVVWGGPSRMHFHGIAELKPGHHRSTGAVRYNLTLRRAR